jgi:hypothetical protein
MLSKWPEDEDDELGSLDADADEPVPIELEDPELEGDDALVSDEPVLDEPVPMLLPEDLLLLPMEPWLESRLVLLVLGELEVSLVLLPLF